MRSSTSSSDIYTTERAIPGGAWARPFLVGISLLILAVALLEGALWYRGFQPTIVDSASRWAGERARATALGARAVVLVGASRAQLDIDLGTLAHDTGLAPVQLAIDGNSYVPVLRDLAADPLFKGVVIVEFQDGAVARRNFPDETSRDYVGIARREGARTVELDFDRLEATLARIRQEWLRSYADGAGPWVSLRRRALDPHATPQYLVTLPSRERQANYAAVTMPGFYLNRVMVNMGYQQAAGRPSPTEQQLASRVAEVRPVDPAPFEDNARAISASVGQIEQRGGRVVFVVFPRSGLVWDTDSRLYPRAGIWERFLATTGSKGFHFMDDPATRAFTCPDGSHLDVRDQVPFTHALDAALSRRGWLPASH